jgi:hypothetical protein
MLLANLVSNALILFKLHIALHQMFQMAWERTCIRVATRVNQPGSNLVVDLIVVPFLVVSQYSPLRNQLVRLCFSSELAISRSINVGTSELICSFQEYTAGGAWARLDQTAMAVTSMTSVSKVAFLVRDDHDRNPCRCGTKSLLLVVAAACLAVNGCGRFRHTVP